MIEKLTKKQENILQNIIKTMDKETFNNGGKVPKSSSIQMNCYLCGEERTAPQFYKGQMYGWACIKKVNPSQKKEKGTWVLADSYEIVESNNYSYTIKVTFTPSKEPITMTIIFRKTLGGDWLSEYRNGRFNVEKGEVYIRSDKQFYIDNKYKPKFLEKFD
jgi:hypothetical protein